MAKKLSELFKGTIPQSNLSNFKFGGAPVTTPAIATQSAGIIPQSKLSDLRFGGGELRLPMQSGASPTSQMPVTTPQAPASPARQAAPSAPGTYKGVAIKPGTDAEIAAQMKTIDAGTPTPQASAGAVPSQWMKPDGGIYTPAEVAANIANKIGGAQTNGDIGQIAGAEFSNKEKSAEELRADAAILNNLRNDIAVGESDPYNTGSKSGIAYTPAELSAIERANAGIYDPALNTAYAKLEAKQDADKAELEFNNDMAKLAKTHGYDLEKMAKDNEYQVARDKMKINADIALARMKASEAGAGAGSSDGKYVQGQNPVVDGWVERVLKSGEDIYKIIPGVKNQDLRNQVMLGVNARKFDNAAVGGTLNDINTLNTLLQNKELDNISGFFGQKLGGLWGDAKTAKTQFDQISGALQLAKAGNIKGQGAVSDYERKVLKDAAVVAERGQADKDFRNALVKIRGAMMTSAGLEAPVKIYDPATGQSQVQNLNSNEISDFIKDGALIEYVE